MEVSIYVGINNQNKNRRKKKTKDEIINSWV